MIISRKNCIIVQTKNHRIFVFNWTSFLWIIFSPFKKVKVICKTLKIKLQENNIESVKKSYLQK